MIVRILGEGQYDVSDDALGSLNEHDGALEAAIDAGDEEAFAAALAALLDTVRSGGLAHDLDASLEEVRAMLADDGLIPG